MGEDDTEDQTGSPDRLMETTSQPRATALLQIREPEERVQGLVGATGTGDSRGGRDVGGRREGEGEATEEAIPTGDDNFLVPAHGWTKEAQVLISHFPFPLR